MNEGDLYMPKVSVIVPVYEVEQYIERCARSLFEQTLDDIEYLFIDDCTPDKSIEILERVVEEYPERKHQVKFHKMENNSGQAAVRVWGLKHFTGEYVTHCDSDDWIDLNTYQTMYDKAIYDHSDCVVCNYAFTDGQGSFQIINQMGGGKKQYISSLLLRERQWSLCNKLFSKSAVESCELVYPSGNMGEDMLLCLQLLLKSNQVSFVDEAFYKYYRNPASITLTRDYAKIYNNVMQLKDNADKVIEVFRKEQLDKQYSREFRRYKYYIKRSAMRVGVRKEYHKAWCRIYPELHCQVLFMKVGFKEKLLFYICLLGLNPLIDKQG